ncbi:cysteine desulfurase [Selenomonas sp.]|mgnify:FL=1|uniref:cysteine desulfurase n=1 Tax=Selenomonas sp. TaxID=2053611 RepID=UPI001CB17B8E|nr:cysteine desulfurase [Selenomonas sp.]MBF1691664.1 cysteine desulfurase [Selenomonas sp.]MBF1694253.1 cysteine desulfurase [Selenomonas sp.]MBF1695755.1 cysteine desulfurase [Selenomonas sp.]MBF1714313.1 cysteine desulfurase [Selenomonas sp.]
MERKVNEYLRDFPILQTKMNGRPIVYLDNGATTQKPETVIRAVADYCTYCNANPHRGAYELSVKATDIYERARVRTQQFIGAARPEEVVFTKNATEALNLVAYSYGLANVREGDEIVITISEHHSNIVPWQFVAKSRGAVLKYIYLGEDGNLSEADIAQQITERTKIVAVTQVSNVLGLVNDVRAVADRAHAVGAVVVVDGSQSVPHIKVDVQAMDADFFAFSGHKMLSPMGIGVLYGKYNILDAMPPFLFGGDMIDYVGEQETTFAELPAKFEAGTQNVSGASGLIAAIDYLDKIGFDRIEAIERDLLSYALPQLRELPFVELYGCDSTRGNKTGIITFNVKDVHPHDVSTILDSYGVAIRAGHHCAQPLMRYLGQNATCRASFYLYNTHEDIDQFIAALKKVRGVLGYAD